MLKADGIIWLIAATLDEFVADDAGGLDFMNDFDGKHDLADEVMHSVGAILTGRRSYDDGLNHPDPSAVAYGGAMRVPTFVVSRRPPPPDVNEGLSLDHAVDERVPIRELTLRASF